MDPINYLAAVPQEDFLRDIQGGLQLGQVFQQRRMQNEQRQMALDAAKQYQADLQAAMTSPTPQSFASLALKYPQQREAVKQAWDGLSEGDRKAEGDTMAQAYSALLAGNADAARGVVQAQIDARKNSGLDTSHYDNALALLNADPKQAQAALGFTLSHINDPKTFATQFGALRGDQRSQELQTDLVRKGASDADAAAAEATTKGVQAKYADQGALLDLQKKGWDIKAIQSDMQYKRDQTRIETMKVALGKADNDLKRKELELKINDAVTARDDKLRAKVADAESAASNIDNMLNTIKRVQAHPALKDVVGSIEGRDLYPNTLAAAATTVTPYGLVSSSGDERADAIALINTLGSQAFLSQVPSMKGQGSLSNAEGEKLQAALTNLSRKQSEGQFNANLNEAARILTKARNTVSKRYGVPLGNPDTPAGGGKRPELDSFWEK